MRNRKMLVVFAAVAMLSALGLNLALAQTKATPSGDRTGVQARETPRGDRRGGGRGDPQQWRQRFMDRIKENLQASDEEWKVLQPRLDKVMTLSREARGSGGRGGRGARGGRRGGATGTAEAAEPPKSETQKAVEALQKALENKAAAAEEIKAKLTAVREAREKAKQELAKAKDALRQLVTQRQEAQLVLMGYLD